MRARRVSRDRQQTWEAATHAQRLVIEATKRTTTTASVWQNRRRWQEAIDALEVTADSAEESDISGTWRSQAKEHRDFLEASRKLNASLPRLRKLAEEAYGTRDNAAHAELTDALFEMNLGRDAKELNQAFRISETGRAGFNRARYRQVLYGLGVFTKPPRVITQDHPEKYVPQRRRRRA